ncbi:13228_t:CDS:2 [Funneliformis caledonium]|uniref:Maltase n=1 Tax=Funneliformis caledonium TaxID=1117310 RepID=A0A9N9CMY3_9GLOM|nr:13228_t:CDS:2 [Funneliformis caledonium]
MTTLFVILFSCFSILPWLTSIIREKNIPFTNSIEISKNNNSINSINESINICSISDARYDCGYFGINKEQCESRFCCWRPSEDAEDKWCFYKKGDPYSCDIDPATRVDCGYRGIQAFECINILNCCWNPTDVIGGNYCYYKSQPCKGYKVVNVEYRGNGRVLIADLELNGIGCGLYGHDSRHLKFLVEYETAERLHVKIYDPKEWRFEVPEEIVPIPLSESINSDLLYHFIYDENPFTFSIARADTGEKIIDTDVPGMNSLVFEDQYMEITFKLPQDPFIYGLGEVVDSLRRDPRGTFQTIWNRDAANPVSENIYGAQPFYLEIRNGTAHGVFLRNSNGMDVTITPGNPAKLNWKVIGGVFDFYIFLGPTPSDVVTQYTEVVGRASLPPYWALGYHQCRWGYHSVKVLEKVVSKFKSNNIPLETIWTDLDYMEGFKDFTWNPTNYPRDEMVKFLRKLHEDEQHYVAIVDPAIKIEAGYYPYDEGIRRNVFIKNYKEENIIGRVWPGLTVFPDWFNEDTPVYWGDMLERWLKNVMVDGLWIDMNEPSSWCRGECIQRKTISSDDIQLSPPHEHCLEQIDNYTSTKTRSRNLGNPPYKINNGAVRLPLDESTLAMDAVHHNGFLEYDVHNLFGHMESMITYNILSKRIRKGKRPFIITRSNFAGTGKYAGHWTGDNWSNWSYLYYSIPGILNFQIFGIALVGADICGFGGAATEELCLRWMQLGSFYPFMRNHNALLEPGQEPYLWPSVAIVSRKFLNIRYSMLPYYYTLFYEAHSKGSTVWRPLFFEFPSSKHALLIDRQFMIGSGLLLSPVLSPQQTIVEALIPPGLWYDYYTEKLSFNITNLDGIYVDLWAPLKVLPILIRGGNIIPMQYPELTTAATKRNNYYLIVALDGEGDAKGTLYVDDGESIDIGNNFTYTTFIVKNSSALMTRCDRCDQKMDDGTQGYNVKSKLDKIIIMGIGKYKKAIKEILLNGNYVQCHWFIDRNLEKLTLSDLELSLNNLWNLTWVYD